MLESIHSASATLLRGLVEVPPLLAVAFLGVVTVLVVAYFGQQVLRGRRPGALGGSSLAQEPRAPRRR